MRSKPSQVDLFQPSTAGKDPGGQAGRASFTALVFIAARAGLQLASIMILARLVAPEQQGVFALSMPVLMVAFGLSQLGMPQAIMQQKTIRHEDVSAIFWLTAAIGLGLTLCFAALGPLASFLYDDERMTGVFAAMSVGLFFMALSGQYSAILYRNLLIGTAERAAIIASVLALCAAGAAALWGAGYWALVLQQVLQSLIGFILLLYASQWRPQALRDVSFARARHALKFGGFVSGFTLVTRVTFALPIFVLGDRFGSAPAALFYRSLNVARLPADQLLLPFSRVVVPILSQLLGDAKAYNQFYSRMTQRLCLMLFPIGIFVAAAPDLVVDILLGELWINAAPIVAWSSLVILQAPLARSFEWALLCDGQPRVLFLFSLCEAAIVIAIVLAAAPLGVVPAAAAFFLATVATRVFGLGVAALARSSLTLNTLLSSLIPDILYGAAAFAALTALRAYLPVIAPVMEAAVLSAGLSAMYGARILASSDLRRDVLRLARRGR